MGGFRRSRGVIHTHGATAGTTGAPINDGGHDAPLAPRGRLAYRLTLSVLIALGLAALLVYRLA